MKIRQSTAEYFHDSGLRNAVNDLTDENARIISRGMNWNDYPDLVEAWRASQEVVADFALSLNDCWLGTWGKCDLSGLTALEFDYQIDDDDEWRDPISTWENWWTGRYFAAARGHKIWLGAGFDDAVLQFGLYPVRGDKLLKLRFDGFDYDRDMTIYVANLAVPIQEDGTLEIDQFFPLAESGLRIFRSSIENAAAR